MGFQIIFSFHKRKDAGYDMETASTLTRKVGKDDEDTPLEQVVMVVKSQLARRDIFVTNLEIYEFVKKKVKFKEVKGGFIIKDKKFLMDQIQGIPVASDDEPLPQLVPSLPPPQARPSANEVPMALHPQRFEVYDPEPHHQVGKYKLTPGKKYAIYRDWGEGIPPLTVTKYLIKDDRGMEVTVPAEYFVAVGKGLIPAQDGQGWDGDPLERQMNKNLTFQNQFLENRSVPYQKTSPNHYQGVPAELLEMPDLTAHRSKGK